jgi:serine/threonine protein kinase
VTDLSGRHIGGYQILARLGAGEMGEVYRAKDLKLGREVALKVLAASIADNPAYLRRFEDEARSASVLNHPNIVTIYGVGEDGPIAFIAMELVQGRTLRDLCAGDGRSLKGVIDIAVQLAYALAAAHGSGIVHRDLKPENVMVTPDGLVTVLDFGLARRQDGILPAQADHLVTQAALTHAGMILGTVGYMSPEQAAGRPAGPASDQFSFGVILYEMLCGQRAFDRPTAVEALSAIIREQPTVIQSLNAGVTAPLQRVVERCLAKNPAERYATTRDLAVQLCEIREQWRTIGRN